jgi:hypothetical protein
VLARPRNRWVVGRGLLKLRCGAPSPCGYGRGGEAAWAYAACFDYSAGAQLPRSATLPKAMAAAKPIDVAALAVFSRFSSFHLVPNPVVGGLLRLRITGDKRESRANA